MNNEMTCQKDVMEHFAEFFFHLFENFSHIILSWLDYLLGNIKFMRLFRNMTFNNTFYCS